MKILERIQSKLKELEQGQESYIKELSKDFYDYFSQEVFDKDFISNLKEVLKDPKLKIYNPYNFYWINLIESILTLEELIYEQNEDELIYFFEDSEFNKDFLDLCQSGLNSFEAATEVMALYQDQVLSFYFLHIFEDEIVFDKAIKYQTITEIGDQFKYSRLEIRSIDKKNNKIEIENNHKLESLDLNQTKFKKVSENLYLLEEKNFANYESKLKKATERLHKIDQTSFQALGLLSRYIIPIDTAELVSHSMQNLPYFSSINMSNRDDLDLIDDLLHENGHHFLNLYLNLEELIFEDDEKIFYSPWRETLRPIRGLYHAYCTFCWALYIYSKAYHKSELFEDHEVEKIKLRICEEYYMLTYSADILKSSKAQSKISKKGKTLLDDFESWVKEFCQDINVESIESQLSAKNSQEIQKLKKQIKENPI